MLSKPATCNQPLGSINFVFQIKALARQCILITIGIPYSKLSWNQKCPLYFILKMKLNISYTTVFTQYMLSLDLFIVHLMLTSEVLTLNHFLSMNNVRMEANHHVDKGPSLF